MNNFLHDQNGHKSSKRLWGSLLLFNGIALKNGEWLLLLFKKIPNIEVMQQSSDALIYMGSALLGISVIEFLKPKNNV